MSKWSNSTAIHAFFSVTVEQIPLYKYLSENSSEHFFCLFVFQYTKKRRAREQLFILYMRAHILLFLNYFFCLLFDFHSALPLQKLSLKKRYYYNAIKGSTIGNTFENIVVLFCVTFSFLKSLIKLVLWVRLTKSIIFNSRLLKLVY